MINAKDFIILSKVTYFYTRLKDLRNRELLYFYLKKIKTMNLITCFQNLLFIEC